VWRNRLREQAGGADSTPCVEGIGEEASEVNRASYTGSLEIRHRGDKGTRKAQHSHANGCAMVQGKEGRGYSGSAGDNTG
jgi:hypothetical protein